MAQVERDRITTDDNALRRMVQETLAQGWESDAGQRLLATVEEHARGWAPALDRHCGLRYGTVAPHDLVTEVWQILERSPQRVIDAQAPWAYLWNAVRNAASVAAAGAAVGSAALAERNMSLCRTVAPPLRVGHETWKLDRAVVPESVFEGDGDRWSPALRCLLDLLVERGADRRLWADAIDRAVEVMADARRSYEEHTLRRDPYLRLVLGLRPDQLSALGALLIGTRRGNRAQQSLLLALHRDQRTLPEQVPGAAQRIRALLDLEDQAAARATPEAASA